MLSACVLGVAALVGVGGRCGTRDSCFRQAAIASPTQFGYGWPGRLLHKIMSPLVFGAIFFAGVTPTGWIMRLRGKDVLSLKRRPDQKSYWIRRPPASPETETMKNQF